MTEHEWLVGGKCAVLNSFYRRFLASKFVSRSHSHRVHRIIIASHVSLWWINLFHLRSNIFPCLIHNSSICTTSGNKKKLHSRLWLMCVVQQTLVMYRALRFEWSTLLLKTRHVSFGSLSEISFKRRHLHFISICTQQLKSISSVTLTSVVSVHGSFG